MTKKKKERVFISWSGKAGQQIAEALAETILHHFELEPWVSSTSIGSGNAWFQEIINATKTAKYAVGCLTPGASLKPWVNFEAGLLYGRLNNFKILKFGESIRAPLTNLQVLDGTNRNDLVKLLNEMISAGRDEAERWVEFKFGKFEETLRSLQSKLQVTPSSIDENVRSIVEAVAAIRENENYRSNVCLKHVISTSIGELGTQLRDVQTGFSIPAGQYPYHLISLQKNLKPKVRALALVDQQERYWQELAGREILETAREENERIFVFITPEDFTRNFETLRLHAKKYTVRAMSFEALTREFYPFNKDFSIIELPDSKLLAAYDKTKPLVAITFSVENDEIIKHEKMYKKISRYARWIDPESREPMESIRERVFERPLTEVKLRSVEMSDYISVDEYDLHEEEHAYYVEMMEKMLEVFSGHRGGSDEGCKVLELGAGTGIFTKRLVRQPNVSVDAIELDWVCFKRLVYKLQTDCASVKFFNEDSRTFDPDGEYEFIFSSFADHHIKFEDKASYFENVKRNLSPGGRYIVGDEFLPDYSGGKMTRREALEAYHNHIIELAGQNQALVELERAALKSGLDEVGDFKVSCEGYEKILREAGFSFEKVKIGPIGRDDIGGVYVYDIYIR